MKAWIIYDHDTDYDKNVDIVRADTRGQARYHNELVDTCFNPLNLQVTRLPALDGDPKEPIRDMDYVEHAGCWVECHGYNCGVRVSKDMEGDGPVYDNHGRAYCSKACWEADHEQN